MFSERFIQSLKRLSKQAEKIDPERRAMSGVPRLIKKDEDE